MIDPAIAAVAAARKSERAIVALRRDPTTREINRADSVLRSTYRTVPTTVAGIAALADAVLKIEDIEPAVACAIRSICEAARRLD